MAQIINSSLGGIKSQCTPVILVDSTGAALDSLTVPTVSGTSNLGSSAYPYSGAYINSVYAGTVVRTGSYVATLSDTNILLAPSAPITITLPAGVPAGKEYRIIAKVATVANTITVTGTSGAVLFNASSVKTINSASAGGGLLVVSDGSNTYYTLDTLI
jgi:acetyl-CoA carboxylase carboxyltransferase component